MAKQKYKELNQDIIMECCALGCYFCRKVSFAAFKKYKFSMTAEDVVNEIYKELNYYEEELNEYFK